MSGAKVTAQYLRVIAESMNMTDREASREVLNRVAAQLESDAKRFEDSEKLQAIGKSAFESIAEMVAALECDYDRLEELKDTLRQADEDLANGCCEYETVELDDMRQERGELEEAAGDCESREDAEERIQEAPLSIELAGTWSIGDTPTADKAIILLDTGGPATRIVCELYNGEPTRAWIEAQDWGKPWTGYVGGDSETLLTYSRCFYFAEG